MALADYYIYMPLRRFIGVVISYRKKEAQSDPEKPSIARIGPPAMLDWEP
jgi:hypothetical protein